MMTYFLILGLGLYLLYALRDGLLVLQNRRDAKKEAISEGRTASTYIIQQNSSNCNSFKRVV